MRIIAFIFFLFGAANLVAFDNGPLQNFDELCDAHPHVDLSLDDFSLFFSDEKYLTTLNADAKAIFATIYSSARLKIQQELLRCVRLLKVALYYKDLFAIAPDTKNENLSRFGCLFDSNLREELIDDNFNPTDDQRKFLQSWLQCWIIELSNQDNIDNIVDNLLNIIVAQERNTLTPKKFRRNRTINITVNILSQDVYIQKYCIRATDNNILAPDKNFKFIFLTIGPKTYLFTCTSTKTKKRP